MKLHSLILAILFLPLLATAQPDTLVEVDTFRLPPVQLRLQSLGISYMDANVQFFEGYHHLILYTNARARLPLYSDWDQYSKLSLLPTYFQVGLQAGWVDTIRGLKLRGGVAYSYREDSMAYSGDFTQDDTLMGRLASERGAFFAVSIAGIKQTRKLFGFLRLYGGAELELGLSPRSRIRLHEYAYDIGEEVFLDYNTFGTSGKPRLNGFASAILGMETVFFKRLGVVAELRSGLGMQVVVREKAYGLGRTGYLMGIQYYLFDYNRKPLPRLPHMMEPQNGEPPVPEF